jgi:hypothetical protein
MRPQRFAKFANLTRHAGAGLERFWQSSPGGCIRGFALGAGLLENVNRRV